MAEAGRVLGYEAALPSGRVSWHRGADGVTTITLGPRHAEGWAKFAVGAVLLTAGSALWIGGSLWRRRYSRLVTGLLVMGYLWVLWAQSLRWWLKTRRWPTRIEVSAAAGVVGINTPDAGRTRTYARGDVGGVEVERVYMPFPPFVRGRLYLLGKAGARWVRLATVGWAEAKELEVVMRSALARADGIDASAPTR